ncbi:MAG: DsbA family protein [Nitrospinota bacterium]|nr:DsbA family protein [Nitrospinota bacterium]
MKYLNALILFLLLVIPSVGTSAESAEEGHSPKVKLDQVPGIEGKYQLVGKADGLKGAKQIEMIEFFNYSCGHCYKFLETSKRLHEKYKGKLLHKKSPIYWGQQNPYPAMAFYISDKQGVEKKFTQELFDTNFKLQINIFQPRVIKLLAKDYGIEKEMTEGMRDPAIKSKVERSLEMAKQYNANETPTVIINETLKVTPSISGGSVDLMTKNLEVIFDSILTP